MVKAFVAPLKKKAIPRLELMGCLSLARLYSTCKEALQFAEISHCKKVFWIDSQTVLTWLKTSPRKFKPFVSVRVAEIQEGDLVMVIESTRRRTWKMGLVIQTYPGQDGLTRKARIKTATSVFDRPIHKLCLIATKQELN